MSDAPMNTVFAGNPGVGKSTLLNSLVGEVAFKSGVSFGEGLTFELGRAVCGNQTYLDTPGLSDPALRKQAGEAIEQSLKQGGMYRVVFVITLEAGRVRPVDVATIQTVLGACESIGDNYAIIINKIPQKGVDKLKKEENLAKVLTSIFSTGVPPTAFVYINPDDTDLNDEDNVYKPASDELKGFLALMPSIGIQPEIVSKIEPEEFDRRSQALEEKIAEFEKDKAAMQEQMQKDREEFQAQIAALQAGKEVAGGADSSAAAASAGVEFLRHAAPLLTDVFAAVLSGSAGGSGGSGGSRSIRSSRRSRIV